MEEGGTETAWGQPIRSAAIAARLLQLPLHRAGKTDVNIKPRKSTRQTVAVVSSVAPFIATVSPRIPGCSVLKLAECA